MLSKCTIVRHFLNKDSVTCRTKPNVSPSVTEHRWLNRLLDCHEARFDCFNKQLSSIRPFCENRLSDCNTFTVRRFIVLSFKHQTNNPNRYISPIQPMRVVDNKKPKTDIFINVHKYILVFVESAEIFMIFIRIEFCPQICDKFSKINCTVHTEVICTFSTDGWKTDRQRGRRSL